MKVISLYIPYDLLNKANAIYLKQKVEGISFYDVNGRGPANRPEYYEVVDGYMTGKTYTADFQSRVKLEVAVPDSSSKEIVEDLLKTLNKDSNTIGKIFVKDISEAYDLGTKDYCEKAITI